METFGKQLEKALKIRGMEPEQLAEKICTRITYIYQYIYDKKIPKIETLGKIENVLNFKFENVYIHNIDESLNKKDVKVAFGLNLGRLLIDKRITVSEFARRTGMAPASISKYISGRGNPTLDILECISENLEVSIPELIATNNKE